MRIGGIILLSVMLSYISRPVYPYLSYVVNKGYIVEFLCINKEKPELKCNGKCHLKNKIAKQSKEEKKSESPARSWFQDNFVLWVPFKSYISLNELPDDYCSLYFNYFINYYFLSQYSFFHPPD
jgi:hypothetical protein